MLRGRAHIAALCVGLPRAESVAYARANRQGSHPIGEYQLVQAMPTARAHGSGEDLLIIAKALPSEEN